MDSNIFKLCWGGLHFNTPTSIFFAKCLVFDLQQPWILAKRSKKTWFAGKSPIYKDYVPIYINAYNLWAMSHCHVWLPEGSSSSISGSANPFGFRTSVGPSGICSVETRLSRPPGFLLQPSECWKSGSQNCRCKKNLGPSWTTWRLKILRVFHKIHGKIHGLSWDDHHSPIKK